MGGALIVVAHLQMILWPGILIDIKLHQEQNHILDAHILAYRVFEAQMLVMRRKWLQTNIYTSKSDVVIFA